MCQYPCKYSELEKLTSHKEIEVWTKCNVLELIEQAEKNCSNKDDVINRVINCINNEFNKNITLDLVAAEVGLSPQYLSKVFKKKYGSTFIEYITNKRLNYAKELLRKGNMSIKEISKLIGYEDPNYFCKVFKKETGTSPKNYRTKAAIGV
jgi:two-component system response regulator YesN